MFKSLFSTASIKTAVLIAAVFAAAVSVTSVCHGSRVRYTVTMLQARTEALAGSHVLTVV